jgi:hypothetical protein
LHDFLELLLDEPVEEPTPEMVALLHGKTDQRVDLRCDLELLLECQFDGLESAREIAALLGDGRDRELATGIRM